MSTPAAQRKVAESLAHLERAQRELGMAMESLSPVIGMVRDWERLGKLYDKINAEWHRLNGRRDWGERLDSEPKISAVGS